MIVNDVSCDTRSGDLVFFPAAFDEFSVFTKIYFIMILFTGLDF